MKRKKIVFVINKLGVGGAERVFVDDTNALHTQEYEVHVVCLYGHEIQSPLLKELRIPVGNIHFLDAKHILDYRGYKKLYALIVHKDISVCYATLHDATFIARLVAMCIPRLWLVTREANTTEFKSFLHKISDILMNWRVNSMVAVSEEVKKSMLSYQSWYAYKVKILYNGVSLSPSVGVGDPYRMLAVGSLTPKKNYPMLIDAFEIVHTTYSNICLYVIGEGVQKTMLQDMVQKKGLQRSIIFVGRKSHQEVEREYCNGGIFVLSSDQEGCPNVLLEAMSFGLPAVATAVGAVPEIIDDGVSGFVVPRRDSIMFAQQIIKLLESKDLRDRIGFGGREKIKREFSNEVHLTRLKDILGV